jgi:5-methyltetrahydrofolate--homocysteine methyltransferase
MVKQSNMFEISNNNYLTNKLINDLTKRELRTKEEKMADFQNMIDTLIEGDEKKLTSLAQSALDEGISAKEILEKGLMAGMDIVGEKMEAEDMFIPEVLRSAKSMSAVIDILKPLLAEGDIITAGKVIIGTVKGDLHDIGKNLVAMMLESAGFEVYNLGADILPDTFVEEIKDKNAVMLCLSALLTTTMPMMKTTIDALSKNGLREQVKVMIGGAPVTQDFADQIGADGYAHDAGSATRLAKALLQ